MGIVIFRYYGIDKFPLLEKYKDKKVLELDVHYFKYMYLHDKQKDQLSKTRNPEFPRNIIALIKEKVPLYDIIIVYYNKEIIESLNTPSILIYPNKDTKEQCWKNIEDAGFSEYVAARILNSFDRDMHIIENDVFCRKVPILKDESVLKDVIINTIEEYFAQQGEI